MTDLSQLLARLDPHAELAHRHIWLIDLLDWVRGDGSSAAASASRVVLLLDALDVQAEAAQRFRAWWQVLTTTVDGTMVLADYGFSARSAFFSEAAYRLRRKLLPGTPETTDAAELFSMVFPRATDVTWINALDATTLARLGQWLTGTQVLAAPDNPVTLWQSELLLAMTFCASQIRATGFTSELRQRMSPDVRQAQPFTALAADVEAFQQAYALRGTQAQALADTARQLRERLELCRQAAATVYPHLDEHGISVNLVFMLRQLRERVLRVRDLMDCLLSATPEASAAKLVARLVHAGVERTSLRALVQANASMLAAKVAERSAETGEHYITRDRAEYRDMLIKAAGGGAATSLTTWFKFIIGSLGFTAFWAGLCAGVMYAASFVLIQLLHWTLATKQPAMTAPAMAAKLKDLDQDAAVESFVDEVTHLVRSQVAAVVGNVGIVAPAVLLISLVIQALHQHPMINAKEAAYVFHSLDLLRPSTLLFAAFTGVLLFGSSLIAGWAENWFVLHRLDSAMRYNPRITNVLGVARANRWAQFMRAHISGFAANVSLGMMLGVLPPVLAFFSLGLEARHVTLSAGQLAAAAASMGSAVWTHSGFWWCVAAIPFIGMLNLSVSFYLAFRLALRAHSVTPAERERVSAALLRRWRQQPMSFLKPA